MKNSVKQNYFYNLIYEFFSIAIPIITMPYISRVLGAKAIGDYNYTLGIVSYFNIVAVTGTKSFAQREIGAKQKDKEAISIIFWEVFGYRLFCTLVTLLFYCVFILNRMPEYTYLFKIHLLNFLSWIFDIGWFFQGIEKFKIIATRNSIVKILGAVLIFLCVKTPNDIGIYAIIYVATSLFGNLSMWIKLKKELVPVSFHSIKIFKNTKDILELFIPVISIQVYTILDKTMLGALCDTIEVGYYTQAEKIIKLALTIISSLIVVLTPRISLLNNEGDIGRIKQYCTSTLDYIFMIALPMMIGCIFVADSFVPVFFGEGYEQAILLMQILSILFIVLSLGQLFGGFLVAMKRQKMYTLAVTSAAVVNFALNFIFIKIFSMKSVGVALATIIAESISTIIQLMSILDLVKLQYIIQSIKKYILPCICLCITLVLVKTLISNLVLQLILSVSFGVLIYFIVLLLKKDEIIYSAIGKIIKK